MTQTTYQLKHRTVYEVETKRLKANGFICFKIILYFEKANNRYRIRVEENGVTMSRVELGVLKSRAEVMKAFDQANLMLSNYVNQTAKTESILNWEIL